MAPTKSRAELSAEARERLLEAATELVAGGGYAGTGVDTIARRAGVAKSALYWHFGSKKGLLEAALQRTAGQWVEPAEPAAALGSGGPLDRLLAQIRQMLIERPETTRLILSTLLERSETSPEARESVAQILANRRNAIARALQRIAVVPLERVQDVAGLLLACVHGALLEQLAEPEVDHLARELARIRPVVLDLLGLPGPLRTPPREERAPVP